MKIIFSKKEIIEALRIKIDNQIKFVSGSEFNVDESMSDDITHITMTQKIK